MTTYRKLVIERIGGTFRQCTGIRDERLGDPEPGEVLVRNHFAGVNGVYDQMMCLNRIDHLQIEPGFGAGVEAVGIVGAVGAGVERFTPGDAVASVSVGNGYRTWQRLPASDLIPVSSADPQVLALVPSGVSALLALERVGELRAGETVCVTAAAGGLGNVAVQIAINAGNHVIGVCGSDAKARALQELGVHRVVQYRREPLPEVLRSEYRDAINLGMDSVGREFFDALLENLAPLGRLLVCGFTSDRLPTEKVLDERIYTRLYWKGASVRGFMNYRYAEHAADARRRLFDMLASQELRPLVDATPFRGLESVADAVEHLLRGDNLGKVVVDLRAD